MLAQLTSSARVALVLAAFALLGMAYAGHRIAELLVVARP